MKLYSENENYKLYQGSMLDMLEVIEHSTIDSIVCDPPYELNFMGKGWDNSGIAFQPDTWKKCYEVLKPGGYLLAFGGSRTFHRIACAIEDAGFEIRDTIMWLYGSGFPKSMDISKQIDKRPNRSYENLNLFGKKLKEQRELKGYSKNDIDKMMGTNTAYAWWEGRNYLGEFKIQLPDKENYKKLKEILELNDDMDFIFEEAEREIIGQKEKLESYQYKNNNVYQTNGDKEKITLDITIPSTELAKKWQGWGTALKPSFEPIIVARKPFKGSLVDNVIEYGVGGINIDECRVGNEERFNPSATIGKDGIYNWNTTTNENEDYKGQVVNGRFPANTILTYDETPSDERLRYFYCAKASKKDRDEGCQDLEDTVNACSNQAIAELKRGNDTFSDEINSTFNKVYKGKNTHPTVKPTELMQYLVRIVTPNNGIVLDPFNGSGSTGKAVMYENRERNKNYKYIGIELTEEYLPIAKARIEYVSTLPKEDSQLTIFDLESEETNE